MLLADQSSKTMFGRKTTFGGEKLVGPSTPPKTSEQPLGTGEGEDGWSDDEMDSEQIAAFRRNRVSKVKRSKSKTMLGIEVGNSSGDNDVDMTSSSMQACFKLTMFVVTNGLLMFLIFGLPKLTAYRYQRGWPARNIEEVQRYGDYVLLPSGLWTGRNSVLKLAVEDSYIGMVTPEEQVRQYASRVWTPLDQKSWPGWQLQDILDIPRVTDTENRYVDPDTGNAMIQDYQLCSTSCLDAFGVPKDMRNQYTGAPTRDFAAEPYGSQLGVDYYVRQDVFYEWLDRDFFHAAAVNGTGDQFRAWRGGYGLDEAVQLDDRLQTTPNSNGFICNLGAPRYRLRNITIQAAGCHVQVHSTQGDGYSVYVRQRNTRSTSFSIEVESSKDDETGCTDSRLLIQARNSRCKRPTVYRQQVECFDECNVILLKGDRARQIPIAIEADDHDSAPLTTLVIQDQFLDIPQLNVTGAKVDVQLSNAHVRLLNIKTTAGQIKLDHVRYDLADLESVVDDIILEDDRNTVLRFRSAANFLCLAAPLVEAMPYDVTQCVMDQYDELGVRQYDDSQHSAHEFYDTTPDGYVDRNEFAAGLAALSLTFDADSLDLSDEQSRQLFDHVFSDIDPASAMTQLPYQQFQQQLHQLAPFFTTLYDSTPKQSCYQACTDAGTAAYVCQQQCTWECLTGGMNITEATYGLCDQAKGCVPSCGAPDSPYNARYGSIDYKYYDVNPPDGVVTYEEFRQALLKIYGNCSYVIEPYDRDYTTCTYSGGGLFQESVPGEERRNCRTYSAELRASKGLAPYDKNPPAWRVDNPGIPHNASVYGLYARNTSAPSAPLECRPFPDYDPALTGPYDNTSNAQDCPACFLPDGVTRVPPQYYARSTWSAANYNQVMQQLQAIFGVEYYQDRYFPYFNMTDDDQFRVFASQLFAQLTTKEKVSYAAFDNNLQSLGFISGVGDKSYLLNPECFKGYFLKTGPGNYSGVSAADLADSFKIKYAATNPNVVETYNMPGFDGAACDATYGDGTPSSTAFSYFAWADAATGVGYKWGKALPMRCLDEAWPDGGDGGKYPGDPRYGSLAGQPILPGCVARDCKPQVYANAVQGSIHAQVLPFDFDFVNPGGQYHSMRQSCLDSTGASQCFYKGYGGSFDYRLRRQDQAVLTQVQEQNAPTGAPDMLLISTVSGPGIPDFKKWFWVSRPVYMAIEPAFLAVLSAGVLQPKMKFAHLQVTPGHCDALYGAVEHIDWMDKAKYGPVAGAAPTSSSLRLFRESLMWSTLVAALTPTSSPILRGELIMKVIWRAPFVNESLYDSPITLDPIADTDPGFTDSKGHLVGKGPSFRHVRYCADAANCHSNYVIAADNCLAPRALQQSASGDYYLSNCTEYLDPNLRGEGEAKNALAYERQFPRTVNDYQWPEVAALTAQDLLHLHSITQTVYYSRANASTHEYQRWSATASSSGAPTFQDTTTTAWKTNQYLIACIALSAAIGMMCGGATIAVLMYIGMRELIRFNQKLHEDKKVAKSKLESRWRVFLDAVAADHKKARIREWELKKRNGTLEATDVLDEKWWELPDAKRKDAESFACNKASRRWPLVSEYDGSSVLDVNKLSPGALKEQYDKHCMERDGKSSRPVSSSGGLLNPSLAVGNMQALASGAVGSAFDAARRLGTGMAAITDKMGSHVGKVLEVVENRLESEVAGENRAVVANNMQLEKNMREAMKIKRMTEEANNPYRYLMLVIYLTFYSTKRVFMACFGESFPSPFEVVTQIVHHQFRRRLINSLDMFIKLKCIKVTKMEPLQEWRLGGSLTDLEEFEAGYTIKRISVGSDVAVSRNILGKQILYRVAWVRVYAKRQRCSYAAGRTDDKGNTSGEVLRVYVREGPRLWTSSRARSNLEPWQARIPPVKEGECCRYQLPSVLADGEGGTVNFVIQGTWGARVLQINTQTDPVNPTVVPKTLLRDFSPEYQAFCMQNDLVDKDLLKSQGTLGKHGILLQKSIVAHVKGVRPKTEEDLVEEFKRYEKKQAQLALVHSMARQENTLLSIAIPVGVKTVNGAIEAINVRTDLNFSQPSAAARLGGDDDYGAGTTQLQRVVSMEQDEFLRDARRRMVSSVENPRNGNMLMTMASDTAGIGTRLMSITEGEPATAAAGWPAAPQASGDLPPARIYLRGSSEIQRDRSLLTSTSFAVSEAADDDPLLEDLEDGGADKALNLELEMADTVWARFIRDNYVVTGNAITDVETEEVFKAKFRKYCRMTGEKLTELNASELAAYGVRYQTSSFYDMSKVIVNERDFDTDLSEANQNVTYLLLVLQVWLHVLLLWALPWPLLQMVMWQHEYYSETTAVEDVFTPSTAMQTPFHVYTMHMFKINQVVLGACFTWLLFSFTKLFWFYTGLCYNWKIRALMRTIFWIWAAVLLSCTISYLFMVMAWLILGAVVAPQTLLPYCTAVVTLGGHIKSTLKRLTLMFDNYQAAIAAVIVASFAAKVASSMRQKHQRGKKVEPFEIFMEYADEDETMNYDSFCSLLDRLEVEMVDDKKRLLFNSADTDGSEKLGYREFEQIWVNIQSEAIMAKMTEAGMTRSRLLVMFAYSVLILCTLFAFIFIGVAAFVGQGAFGAVVNSSLVAFSGFAMNHGGEDKEEGEGEQPAAEAKP